MTSKKKDSANRTEGVAEILGTTDLTEQVDKLKQLAVLAGTPAFVMVIYADPRMGETIVRLVGPDIPIPLARHMIQVATDYVNKAEVEGLVEEKEKAANAK